MMIKLTRGPIHRMLAVGGLSRLRLVTLDRSACISATLLLYLPPGPCFSLHSDHVA